MKELFKAKFECCWENYAKIFFRYPIKLLFTLIFYISISLNIIILIFSIENGKNLEEILIPCMLAICISIIFCLIFIKLYIKRNYIKKENEYLLIYNYEVSFYKMHLVKNYYGCELWLDYDKIQSIFETKYIFIIKSIDNRVIYLLKKDLNEEHKDFIRNINKNNYKKIEKKKEFMEEVYNPSCLKAFSKAFKILFVMTLISFILPNIIFLIYNSISNIPMDFLLDKLEDWYDVCAYLSIISIILGIKYFKDIKFAKVNLISSIAFFIILFTIVMLFVPLTKDIDYKNVKKYEDILNIRLPKTGEYFQYDELETEKNEKDFLIIEGYYKDLKDKEKVELNINEGNNWITYKKAKKELGQFLIDNLKNKTCNDCYVLVYNKKTGEYNNRKVNKETDSILVAFYNKEENHLFINEYNFKEFIEIKTDIQEAIDGFENNDYKDEDFDDSKTRIKIKIEFEI